MTKVEAHMATYCLSTDSTISIMTVVKRLRVGTVRAMPERQKFSSCHDFSVKLSLCMAISGEDSSTYLLVCDKSCFVRSKSVCCSLRLAPR